MSLFHRDTDWMNPIAVKELRQAVRGKFVMIAVVLSLLAQLVAIGVVMLTTTVSGTAFVGTAGPTAFMTLYTVLFTACVFLVPIYSGFRMAVERADANVDLLFITTIRPRTIVIGKLMSVVALVGLLFGASLPFLVFSYVLRGIDFITIAVLLAVAMVIVISQAILALFIGCLPTSKPFKILLAFGFFFFTLMTYAPLIAMASQLMQGGLGVMFLGSFWTTTAATFISIAAIDCVLLVVTTAMISPPAANRALPVRTVLAIMWLLSFAAAAWATLVTHRAEPMQVWAVGQLVFATLVLFSAIGERDSWGPRVARTIPRNPLQRAIAFLFYSGAAGGILWALLFMAATVALYPLIVGSASLLRSGNPLRVTHYLADAALCLLAYALTAALIRRKFLRRVPPKATWAIALGLFFLVAIVPAAIALVFDAETNTFGRYVNVATLFNPFPMFDRKPPQSDVRTILVAFWAFTALVLNGAWMLAQMRRFRRPDGGGSGESLELRLQEVTIDR